MPSPDPTRIDRSRYVLELDERFAGPALDLVRWLPAYLPQWSSRAKAAARYDLGPDGLTLRVDPDQPPWTPEWDGELRVSSLQTGVRSGPVGSADGQHRFRPDLVVREAQATWWGYAPLHGLVELTCAVPDDPDAMAALWMIGLEDEPERSAELCVMELFGRNVGASEAHVGMGLHPFGNPRIRDDFATVRVSIDARELHTYSAEWLPDRVRWFVDGVLVREVDQAPDHPMQLMLSLYRFPPAPGVAHANRTSTPRFQVRSVRGWRSA
ncbi:MAG: glycoside hydrolase family 16 protein [Chloroflexota bacterium]